jgi:hypothetical protein|tara:strand:+ start:465 stop:938 length:474 start_codon:yes stop_codon:yes gene_type:complete
MNLSNKGKIERLEKGKLLEDYFSRLFKNTTPSTQEQDIHEHWDVQVNFKVDVKGMKKRNRRDDEPDENIHWLEIKNVLGREGWLYGDADYFAFETKKYWIVVQKDRLQEWVKHNIKREMTPYPAMYKLYRRVGAKDLITLISSHDLYYLNTCVLLKH